MHATQHLNSAVTQLKPNVAPTKVADGCGASGEIAAGIPHKETLPDAYTSISLPDD